jgi:mRNA interferase MazF
MNLLFGEAILIDVQFHQTAGSKIRPAVVVLDSGDDDFVAAPITSRSGIGAFDVELLDWRAAGLNVPSTVRLHKVAVLSKAAIRRKLGKASPRDSTAVRELLCRAFCPPAE